MIFAILILALVLRLITLNQSLWLDEAINIWYAKSMSLWDFITKYPIGDFHPPGHFFLIWIWTRVFGFSEIAVRIPSVIFGVLTVFLVYLITKKLFDKKIAYLASLLTAINPLLIYYSQEARMYSLAAFAVTLSWYFLIRIDESKKFEVGYIFSLVLILYSDYVAYLAVSAQLIYVFWLKRELLKKIIISQIVSAFFLIPWFFIFPTQLANGRSTSVTFQGWTDVVGGAAIKNVGLLIVKSIIGRISIENKSLYLSLIGIIGLIYSFILYGAIKKLNSKISLILAWIFFPTLLTLFVSLFIPVFSYFRLLFIVPAFCILVSIGIFEQSRILQKVFITIVALTGIISLGVYYLNPKFHREDWRGVSNFIKDNSNENSIFVLENDQLFAPLNYYSVSKEKIIGGLKKGPAKSSQDVRNLLLSETKIYLIEYLVDVTDPNRLLEKSLRNLEYARTRTFNFNGVGFINLYEKTNKI